MKKASRAALMSSIRIVQAIALKTLSLDRVISSIVLERGRFSSVESIEFMDHYSTPFFPDIE